MPLSPSPLPAGAEIRGDPGLRPLGWGALVTLLVLQVYGLYGAVSAGPEQLFPGVDKVAHALAFGLPALLATLLRSRVVLALLLLHALVAELLQGWLTSGRLADPWDTAANLAGLAAGVAVALLIRSRTRG